MKTVIEINKEQIHLDLSKPIDISMELKSGDENPNCFYAPNPSFEPVVMGNFVGSTEHGSPVNFYNIFVNPHGSGTHTECVGHISKEKFYVKDCFDRYFFKAQVISVKPKVLDNGDEIIGMENFKNKIDKNCEALIIRTLPNDSAKKTKKYSGINPCYLNVECASYFAELNILHLLIDLPSVDREEDGGKLAAHHAFWQYPNSTRTKSSISELIFVPDSVKDGCYILQFQICNIALDVSPSRPVLYGIE